MQGEGSNFNLFQRNFLGNKKQRGSLCILIGELAGKNFGRELVFSADLWYNDANEKPPSEREVARRSRDGRSLRDFRFVLTSW